MIQMTIISSNSCSRMKKQEDDTGQMEDERGRERKGEKFVLRVADRLPP